MSKPRKPEIKPGDKFGRLLVKEYLGRDHNRRHRYMCLCKCGTLKNISRNSLITGGTKSCGCLHKEMLTRTKSTHGASCNPGSDDYRLWQLWKGIRKRCNNPAHKSYSYYGGSGITCDWDTFEKFQSDMKPSYLLHIQKHGKINTTLDRIDSQGNYDKENCRWATRKEQTVNREKTKIIQYNGRQYTIDELSHLCGIKPSTLYYRIYIAQWSLEKALNNGIYERE